MNQAEEYIDLAAARLRYRTAIAESIAAAGAIPDAPSKHARPGAAARRAERVAHLEQLESTERRAGRQFLEMLEAEDPNCRQCGCTEWNPCAEGCGCSWVEVPDGELPLCSACAAKEAVDAPGV